ncbi:MAG: hypothetical protein ABL908_07520, partial [Hyphomicrobium sp.]
PPLAARALARFFSSVVPSVVINGDLVADGGSWGTQGRTRCAGSAYRDMRMFDRARNLRESKCMQNYSS